MSFNYKDKRVYYYEKDTHVLGSHFGIGFHDESKKYPKSLLQKTRESFEKVWNFLSLTWSMYVCRYLKQLLWICCCSVESAVICGLLNSMLLKNWELGALFFALQLRRRPLLLCAYEESERSLSPLLECSSHNTTESRGDCSTPPLYITTALLL